MKRFHTLAALPLLAIALSACASKEYQAEHDMCMADAYAAVPVLYQTKMEQQSRQVQVPSGVTCDSYGTSYGGANTTCRQQYIYTTEYYDVPVQYDANETRRNAMARRCTENACVQKYGNAKCETGKPAGAATSEPSLTDSLKNLGDTFNSFLK